MTSTTEDTDLNSAAKKPLAASVSTRQDTTQQDVKPGARHVRRRTKQGARTFKDANQQAKPKNAAFAKRLGTAMNRKGLNPSQLAGLAWGKRKDTRGYDVSKGRDRVGAYLRGTSYPEPENLVKIAAALEVPVEELTAERPPRSPVTARQRQERRPARIEKLSITAAPDRSGWDDLEVSRQVPSHVAMQIWQLLKDAERNGDDNGVEDDNAPPLGSVIDGSND